MTLAHFIKIAHLDPKKVMDILQDHGAVSDNAIMPEDVGNHDEAINWLLSHKTLTRSTLLP
jgi:hypothetical protein